MEEAATLTTATLRVGTFPHESLTLCRPITKLLRENAPTADAFVAKFTKQQHFPGKILTLATVPHGENTYKTSSSVTYPVQVSHVNCCVVRVRRIYVTMLLLFDSAAALFSWTPVLDTHTHRERVSE